MDSNLITVSSILTQTNIPGLTSSKSDMNKDGTQFSLEPTSNPVKTENSKKETTYNNIENEPIDKNNKSQEKLTTSEKQHETKDNPELTTQNHLKEENLEKISSYTQHELPEKSSLGQIIRNIENHKGIDIAELVSKYKEAIKGDIKGLVQRGETPAGYKNVNSKKSKSLSSFNNDSSKRNNTASVNSKVQIKLPEKTSIKEKLTNISKTIVKNNITTKPVTMVTGGESQLANKKRKLETNIDVSDIKGQGKENIIKNQNQALTANKKLTFLENVSLKDKANGLENKNLANKPSNLSRGLIESAKISGTTHSLNSSKNDYNVKKADIKNLQISSTQTKGQRNLSPGNKSNSGFSRITTHSNQTLFEEQNVSSMTNVRNGSNRQPGTAEDISGNIGKQILESIHSSLAQRGGDRQVTVRLNPPELGQVSIKFQEQEAQLTGLLEVSKTQTRSEIEQVLPQIIRNLSDSGINIKRLEVVLTTGERAEQEAMKENSLFNNQQQQNFNNPGMYGDGQDMTEFHEWLANNISPVSNTSSDGSLAVNSSINLLV